MKETLIFGRRQEYSVTDWERCLEELIAGTLPEQICWTIDMVYCIDRFIVCELNFLYIKSRQIRFIHVTDKSGETGTVLFLKAGGTAEYF